MIEIKKTTSKEVYEEFGFDSSSTVMDVKDGDELLGAGCVTLKDGYAVMDKVCMKESYKMFNMDFGLAKSLLNMVDLAGVKYVFSNIDDDRLMKALRFKKEFEIPEGVNITDEYSRFLCLDGYFTSGGCESCK